MVAPGTGILARPPPSTSGPGRHPFKVVARVRIPLGASSADAGWLPASWRELCHAWQRVYAPATPRASTKCSSNTVDRRKRPVRSIAAPWFGRSTASPTTSSSSSRMTIRDAELESVISPHRCDGRSCGQARGPKDRAGTRIGSGSSARWRRRDRHGERGGGLRTRPAIGTDRDVIARARAIYLGEEEERS